METCCKFWTLCLALAVSGLVSSQPSTQSSVLTLTINVGVSVTEGPGIPSTTVPFPEPSSTVGPASTTVNHTTRLSSAEPRQTSETLPPVTSGGDESGFTTHGITETESASSLDPVTESFVDADITTASEETDPLVTTETTQSLNEATLKAGDVATTSTDKNATAEVTPSEGWSTELTATTDGLSLESSPGKLTTNPGVTSTAVLLSSTDADMSSSPTEPSTTSILSTWESTTTSDISTSMADITTSAPSTAEITTTTLSTVATTTMVVTSTIDETMSPTTSEHSTAEEWISTVTSDILTTVKQVVSTATVIPTVEESGSTEVTSELTTSGMVTPGGPGGDNVVAIAVGATIGAMVAITLIVIAVCCLKKRNEERQRRTQYARDEEKDVQDFTYAPAKSSDTRQKVFSVTEDKNRNGIHNPGLDTELNGAPTSTRNYFQQGLDESEDESTESLGDMSSIKRDKSAFPMRALRTQSRFSLGPVLLGDDDSSSQAAYEKMYGTYDTFQHKKK